MRFQSTRDFTESLSEVSLLIDLSDSQNDERVAAALMKAALLLLAGKFEAFAEDLAEEYVHSVNELALPVGKIPEPLRIAHSLAAIESNQHLRDFSRQQEVVQFLSALAAFWTDGKQAPSLQIQCRFAYGKHGEVELRKLFRLVGLPDVFTAVRITQDEESMLEDGADGDLIDVRGEFNSLTYIRNNILHEDASPTLTSGRVRGFFQVLRKLANGLDERFGVEIDNLRAARAPEFDTIPQ